MTESARQTILAFLASGLYAGPHNIVAYWGRRLGGTANIVAAMPWERGGADEKLREAGVTVRRVPYGRPRRSVGLSARYLLQLPADIFRLRAAIVRERADVVAVMRAVDVAPAIAAKLAGLRIVWHVLDSAPPAWLRWPLGRVIRALADEIPVMTPTIARMHGLEGCARVRYIGPPSDDALYAEGAPPDVAFGPQTGPLVGVVAQLTPMKGIEHFIRAAARVAQTHPDAHFVVVGGESAGHEAYGAALRTEATRVGVDDRLWFAGPRYDLPAVFAALDVLVIASNARSEGLPTVLLNAVMAGTPVLATAAGGIPDVIEHGRTGWLVPPGDETSLADGLRRLLSDETLRRRIAENARREVAPRFALGAWERAYREVFGLPASDGAEVSERAAA